MIKRILLSVLPLLILVPCAHLRGQELSLVDVDLSTFPTVRAKLILVDGSGRPDYTLDAARLSIVDYGTLVAPGDILLDCPPPPPAHPVSLLLLLDRSGSMALPMPRGGGTRIQALRSAAAALVRTLTFTPGTSIAVTAFDDLPSIVSPFQASPSAVIAAINGLTPGTGTDYNPPYLDPFVGAFQVLRGRPAPIPRVIVFVSDGEPTTTTLLDSIVAEANLLGVVVHTVTIGGPPSGIMRSLAERTGGTAYGDVEDAAGMTGLLRLLGLEAEGREACTLTWKGALSCIPSGSRQVLVSVDTPSVATTVTYRPPSNAWVRLSSIPSFIDFGSVVWPGTLDLTVDLTATGTGFVVNSGTINGDTSFAIVDWGGSPPPFSLRDGQSRTITLRFAPTDTALHIGGLIVDGSPCSPPTIPLIGGDGTGNYRHGLVLVEPRGGETYSGCDSVPVRWRGVPDSTPVDIDYSSDNGATWRTVARNASGLLHMWRPPTSGKAFRIRISSRNGALDTITRVAGGGAHQRDTIATFMEFRSPVGVAVDETYLYIAEAGRHRVRRVELSTGYTNTIAGSGSTGYSGDDGPAASARLANPNDVAVDRGLLYIADYSNNRIRRIDLGSGLITTVAGNGLSGFSGDGGQATSASLFHPSHLTLWKNRLYFTDRDNYRIRRVDLATGVIATVAGGGTNPLGDGGQATDVKLTLPAAVTVLDDTLYIAEEASHRIRAVSLSTGRISTLAGDNGPGWSGDGGACDVAQLNRPTGLTSFGRFLIIADEGNNALRLVDRYTRTIYRLSGGVRAGFTGDDGDAHQALLDAPEGLATGNGAIYVADVNNDIVRRIALPDPVTRDSSIAPFSITQPTLSVDPARRSIVFGSTALDASRDSVLVSIVCNRGSAPGYVEQARIIGRDSIDFELLTNIDSTWVDAGACTTIEVRFRPSGIASRRAMLALGSDCFGYDTITLRGIGIPSCGAEVTDLVELGRLEPGSAFDSTVRSLVCNRGTTPLTGSVSLKDNDGSFAILVGEGPFTLQPEECLLVKLRFAPSVVGVHTSRIDFGLSDACAPARCRVVGVGYSDALLTGPSIVQFRPQVCAGSPVDTVVQLVNGGSVDAVIESAEIAPPNAGFTILDPLPSSTTPWMIPSGTSRGVAIRFESSVVGGSSARVVFKGPSTTDVDVSLAGRRDSAALLPDGVVVVLSPGSGSTPPYAIDSVRLLNTGTVSVDIVAASITGNDAASFALVSPVPPLQVPPGGSTTFVIAATSVNDGPPRTARLSLVASPSCTDTISVDVIQEGNVGLARMRGLDTLRLLCPGEDSFDTVVQICNPLGSPLAIDSVWIDGIDGERFLTNANPPLVVAASSCIDIPMSFLPDRVGFFSARFHVRHNGIGDTAIDLRGVRRIIDVTVDPDTLFAGPLLPGEIASFIVSLSNAGDQSGSLFVQLDSSFTFASPPPARINGGETVRVSVTSTAGASRKVARLAVGSIECGVSDSVLIVIDVAPRPVVSISMPIDSALPGTRVTVPITIIDIAQLRLNGVDSFDIRIRFDGLILWPRFVTGAIADIGALQLDGTQHVRVFGSLPAASDTLASVVCDVLNGTRRNTPLSFDEIRWIGKPVVTDSTNGLFVRLEGCGPGTLASRPRLDRIRPTPSRDQVEVDVITSTATDVRVDIIDVYGGRRASFQLGRIAEGTHTASLDLRSIPTGTYWLVVSTPFGQDHARFNIAR